jgi:hypothetical protein
MLYVTWPRGPVTDSRPGTGTIGMGAVVAAGAGSSPASSMSQSPPAGVARWPLPIRQWSRRSSGHWTP